MKPKKLIMSAFCPYSSEVEIDFEAFSGQGLFLITGETGAGKTTIFDGISYALFGEVSGENRGADMLRSDFAKPETETYVKLIFENKGSVYEIKRNPRYSRPVKRGYSGKMTTQNPDAQILLPDNGVITGTKEVTDKVIEILGINHRQFKQISMIAQGEFLKLLFADTKERGEIFRKVFATEIYEKIQRELKNQMLDLKNQLDDIDRGIIQSIQDGIHWDPEDENFEAFMNLKDKIHGLDRLVPMLKEHISSSIEKKQQKEAELLEVQNRVVALAQLIEKGKLLNSQIEQLDERRENLNRLENRYDEMEQIKKQLESGKTALYQVKPKYDEYLRLINEKADLIRNIGEKQHLIDTQKPLYLRQEAELKVLLSREGQRENLVAEIQHLKSSFKNYEILKNIEIVFAEKNRQREGSCINLKTGESQLTACLNRVEQIDQILIPLADVALQKMELVQRKELLLNEREELNRLEELAQKCRELSRLLIQEAKQFELKEEAYKLADEQFTQHQLLFYREQAGILAEKLTDGQQCPVCGSLTHPHKAIKGENAPTQESLNREKEKLEKLRLEWQKLSESCNRISTESKARLEQLKSDSRRLKFEGITKVGELQELIKSRESENREALETEKNNLDQLEKQCQMKVLLEKEREDLQKQQKEIETMITRLKDEIDQIDRDCLSAKTKIDSLKEGLPFATPKEAQEILGLKEDDLQTMKNKLETARKICETFKKEINEAEALKNEGVQRLEKVEAASNKATGSLEEALGRVGFADLAAYQGAFLSEEKIGDLEKIIQKYQDDLVSAKTTIKDLESQIGQQQAVDLIELENEKIDWSEKGGLIQKDLENRGYIIQKNQDTFTNLILKQKARDRIEKAFGEVKVLSDTANGELKGKQKLPFEQYVQGVYFDMVLTEANKRFGKMTDYRYRLLRRDGSGNNQSKSGLEIDIEDHWTLKRRSVKSLSGGEAFKASLALALGLSDIVQGFSGGIRLDTMFIDEGFGSLDGESLEKAMEILAGLSEGNRLVGIISHLDELRERIDKKIIITRDPQGSGVGIEA
jgi:exonuclease SbcC